MTTIEIHREAEGYDADDYGFPVETETGIRCANHPCEWKIRHENTAAVRACHAVAAGLAAEQAAEVYAEAGMSWVAGGGSPADAHRYASVIAAGGTWDGGTGESPMTGELCDHGLDAGLCADPVSHYPPDM